MYLNTLKPTPGAKRPRRRVGRGVGSGHGKTAGRGHKGQKARSGGFHKVGFEGGQMPLQRRLPKRGFTSRTPDTTAEIRLSDLERIEADTIDLAALKAAGVARPRALAAKVFLAGKLTRKVTLQDIGVSKGARAAIEAAGGTIIDNRPKKAERPEAETREAKVAAARAVAAAAAKEKDTAKGAGKRAAKDKGATKEEGKGAVKDKPAAKEKGPAKSAAKEKSAAAKDKG